MFLSTSLPSYISTPQLIFLTTNLQKSQTAFTLWSRMLAELRKHGTSFDILVICAMTIPCKTFHRTTYRWRTSKSAARMGLRKYIFVDSATVAVFGVVACLMLRELTDRLSDGVFPRCRREYAVWTGTKVAGKTYLPWTKYGLSEIAATSTVPIHASTYILYIYIYFLYTQIYI